MNSQTVPASFTAIQYIIIKGSEEKNMVTLQRDGQPDFHSMLFVLCLWSDLQICFVHQHTQNRTDTQCSYSMCNGAAY